MKTPHAILIGLSLIAVAFFVKDTMTPPAHAFGGPDGFACDKGHCYVFQGDVATQFLEGPKLGLNKSLEFHKKRYACIRRNWRTGECVR